MNNKLIDLNNHLFAEMERLGDEELKGDNLIQEIERARAITGVASQIISNGSLALKAEQFKSDIVSAKEAKVPKFLEGE
ncbi:hypothetical protein [Lacrimispora sp.]|uniref:hypothetical protein n=1 Tax=Lacrimispora sp. TaxID=2719234 RepID=UPI0028962CAB|nr:hypothetical protein [Lacrimispora sp.]